MLRDRNGDAILIVAATTEQADFGVFDAQGVVGGLINCRAVYCTVSPKNRELQAP
jgi:hypothetical protein